MLKAFAISIAILCGGLSAANAQAPAEPYPARPITLVVPFAAGGVTDVVARVIGARMSELLGQPLVVENRVGAGGSIGTTFAAHAAPNGYTLLLGNGGTHSTSPITERGVAYDPNKDFTFIAPFGSYSFVLVCNPKVPVTSVAELVALARRQPGKLSYGTAGIGSNVHFIFEYFKLRAGVDITHVPYRGAGPMVADLLAGTTDCSFDGTSRPHIESGRLRALAVAGIRRDPLYPEVPTLDEAGLSGFNLPGWQSLMGPRGMSPTIVRILNEAANTAVRDPDVIAKLRNIGFVAQGGTPAELEKFVAEDTATFRRIARDAKIQLQ
ncbi:MAG: tripartite tricarboxylate transporter substrate binding protein [Ramlibacter sp.]|nr:tripartite tricarboxylate transporter substrate binding protein [Ramlibacter sp.]